MSTKNDSYTSTGLDRMLDQFGGSVNLRALVSVYLDQVQALEDAIHPLLAERDTDQATGDRLDGIGAIVNIKRSGRNDADYRLRLKAELLILGSGGTAEDLLEIAQALIQMGTANYQTLEHYPKTFYIRPVDHVFAQLPSQVGTALRRSVSAATQLLFVYSIYDDDNTFRCAASGSSVDTDAATGLGDVGATQGGRLSGNA